MPDLTPMPLLPSTSALLVQGGDHRIEIQATSQLNKYGCQPFPAADRIAFGSSTASQISASAFEAADALRKQIITALTQQDAVSVYHEQLARLRCDLLEIAGYAGYAEAAAPDLIFAASGTDAHLVASHLVAAQSSRGLRVIMVNPEESGSGVSAALSGRCFNTYNALGKTTDFNDGAHGNNSDDAPAPEVLHVPIRQPDGAPRTAAAIDADFEVLTASALGAGLDVLLVLIDVSKTGCIAPSPALASQLKQAETEVDAELKQGRGQLHVLVDACQFRIEMATLRAYLQQNFMVAMTGSKFIGGPSFSAALLMPHALAASMRATGVPLQLKQHSAQEEWPVGWHAEKILPSCANFGLLLRWQAALCEMHALQKVQGAPIRQFLQDFSTAVQQRLRDDPYFAPLLTPALPPRAARLIPEWDDLQTIHAFTLHRPTWHSRVMDSTEVAAIYRDLQQTRHSDGYFYSLGQPVACGRSGGGEISALRLCVSAGLIVQACGDRSGAASRALIARAMACFDAIAALIAQDKDADVSDSTKSLSA